MPSGLCGGEGRGRCWGLGEDIGTSVAVDACWVFVTVVKADADKERSRQGEKPADSVLPHSGAPV